MKFLNGTFLLLILQTTIIPNQDRRLSKLAIFLKQFSNSFECVCQKESSTDSDNEPKMFVIFKWNRDSPYQLTSIQSEVEGWE